MTGDFVSRITHGEPDLIESELGRLHAPAGVWAILGNHDHWRGAEIVEAAVQRAGIRLLRNDNASIGRKDQELWMAGVDDVLLGHPDLRMAMDGVPGDAAAILLAHEPDFADMAALDSRIALQLSGHSHGGQVRLPFLGSIIVPPLAKKYPKGLRQINAMRLYTNCGLGNIFLPVRFNCRPEVTLLSLRSDATALS